jgi:hypothetical protein
MQLIVLYQGEYQSCCSEDQFIFQAEILDAARCNMQCPQTSSADVCGLAVHYVHWPVQYEG